MEAKKIIVGMIKDGEYKGQYHIDIICKNNTQQTICILPTKRELYIKLITLSITLI